MCVYTIMVRGSSIAIIGFAIWPDLPRTQSLNHAIKTGIAHAQGIEISVVLIFAVVAKNAKFGTLRKFPAIRYF